MSALIDISIFKLGGGGRLETFSGLTVFNRGSR